MESHILITPSYIRQGLLGLSEKYSFILWMQPDITGGSGDPCPRGGWS